MPDDRRTEPSEPPGVADTMPAAEREERERAGRSTIPEIAPPFEQRYRLGVELGRGGMGRVVEAFDTQLGRTVALKEVLPKGGAAVERRFEREVQITARLEHASIVPLYDAGTMPDGRPFYVMRRVTGRPLDELVERASGLPERLALLPNLLAAIDAVAHAHRRGIIHRDLKPANILVGELGETVVIDWGLAKVIGEESEPPSAEPRIPSAGDSLQTQVGSVFGTPGFMPPEQARGEELGPRTDVFALGATLYQLLVGRPPVSGKSATDALVSSMKRRIEPVAVAAPGAPPELVAIVEKALAFEASDRYPNADKLGEDVRRFLTGQVVAAHRYTPRERITRFARRHRAPLSVAALAMMAVAVLAWIGVHRIVVERDAANQAHLEAERQRDTAQKSNAELVEKNDSLVVTKASALVDSNPTKALAILKGLRPTSPRIADARAIAMAAVVRGVAWGLRCDGDPRFLAVNRDASRLALMTADGALHVWDLETHRVMFEHGYSRNARPLWVENDRLLITRPGEAPDLFDPKTGVGERLATAPSWLATATDRGDRVVMVQDGGVAVILDVATRAVKPLWPGHKARSIAISGDGKWIAISDGATTVVLDAAGTEVTQHPGDLGVEATFRDRLAVIANRPGLGVSEVLLGSTPPAWRDLPLDLPPKAFIITAHYRGTALDVVTSASIFTFRDGKVSDHAPLDDYNVFMLPDAGPGVSITTGRDGNVHFYSATSEGTIMLPVGMTNAHLAGRPGHTRFVVASNGIVLVYDLADILPVAVPKRGLFEATFADDETLLLWPDSNDHYHWKDLVTGALTEIEHVPNMSGLPLNIDPRDGRVMVTEQRGDERALVVFTKGSTHPRMVAQGVRITGRLVPGGVLFGEPRDPRVLFARGDEPGHELAKVDGGVQSLATLDGLRYAALGRSGELVRGSLRGGAIDRTHVDIGPDAFLAADRAGHVIVATGTRLLIWDGPAARELVKLTRPLAMISSTAGGLVVMLDDNQTLYVEIGPGTKVTLHALFTSSAAQPAVAGDGTWIASAGNGGQITVIELPSLARWTMPIHYHSLGQFLVASPTRRRLMQGTGTELEVMNLPEPSGDLAAWIEDRTNAFETNDGLLAWPWQRP